MFGLTTQAAYLNNQVLVQYRGQAVGLSTVPGTTPQLGGLKAKSVKLLQEIRQNRAVLPTGLVQTPPEEGIYQIELLSGTTVTAAIQALQGQRGVITVQPNFLYNPLELPNDPYLTIPNDQNVTTYQYAPYLVDLPTAWTITTGNPNTLIAVIDSGIDITHPEFTNRLSADSTNILDPNSSLNDGFTSNGNHATHGTHVAGIIAANGNNAQGVAGAAFGCKLLIIKAIDDTTGTFSTAALLASLSYAAAKNVNIVNMSLGGSTTGLDDTLLHNQINALLTLNISVVAAAGNSHINLDDENMVPAKYSGVIAVSGANTSGEFDSSYSNYGASVSIMAPGTAILGTIPTQSYGTKKGTSMATPMVSGILGLLKSYAPAATRTQLYNAITSSATDKGTAGRDPQTGYGLVNAYRALQRLDATPPSITHTRIVTGNSSASIPIIATITDNFPTPPSASVTYREYINSTAMTDWTTRILRFSGSTYSGTLPLSRSDLTNVKYYLSANDAINTTTLPSGGTASPYNIVIQDFNGPTIRSSLQTGDYVSSAQSLVFTVTDNVNVNTSSLRVTVTPAIGPASTYSPGQTAFSYNAPTLTIFTSGGEFTLPAGSFTLTISATDINANTASASWTLTTTSVLDLYGPNGAGSKILSKPNPFNPNSQSAKLCFQLTADAQVEITIYDLRLRQVKKITQTTPAGYTEITWPGQDDTGSPLPNGMYIAVIKASANGKTLTQKVKIGLRRG